MKHELLQKQQNGFKNQQSMKGRRKEAPERIKNHESMDPLQSAEPALPSSSNSPNQHQLSLEHFYGNGQQMSDAEDDDVVALPDKAPEVFEIDDEEDESDYFKHEDGDGDGSEDLVVAVNPDSMYGDKVDFYQEHGFPAHFLDFAETSSPQRRREVVCRICQAVFPSIVGLKIHEQKTHRAGLPTLPNQSEMPILTVKESFPTPKKTSIQCSDCDAVFKSYYHMQKHRDLEHSESASFKCTFPYCRTRGESLEEINEHYNKFHNGVTPPPPKKRKRRSKNQSEVMSD